MFLRCHLVLFLSAIPARGEKIWSYAGCDRTIATPTVSNGLV